VKPGTGCRGIVFRTVRFGLPSKPVLALDTAIRAFTTALSSVSWAPANWHPSIPHCRTALEALNLTCSSSIQGLASLW